MAFTSCYNNNASELVQFLHKWIPGCAYFHQLFKFRLRFFFCWLTFVCHVSFDRQPAVSNLFRFAIAGVLSALNAQWQYTIHFFCFHIKSGVLKYCMFPRSALSHTFLVDIYVLLWVQAYVRICFIDCSFPNPCGRSLLSILYCFVNYCVVVLWLIWYVHRFLCCYVLPSINKFHWLLDWVI